MAYWWLNQKEDDFALLAEEDVLAVPRRDKLGRTSPAFAVAGEMRPGDLGFAFVGDELDGVFAVVEPPQDDTIEMAPDFQRRAARLVPVRYFSFATPVRGEETILRLRDLLPVHDSPLDPDGATRDTSVRQIGDDLAGRLVELAADAEPMSFAIGEAMTEAIAAGELPEQTKNDLIGARLGIGPVSEAVRALWNGACSATGTTVDALVQICAIKPWVRASNDERLDAENALPLVPTWTHAFANGLVAFDEDGAVLLSAELPAAEARKVGIDPGFRLQVKGERQAAYLAWHRRHVFVPG